MRIGLYVLAVFAAAWGVAALAVLQAPSWSDLAPVALSAAIVAIVARKAVFPVRTAEERRRARRQVLLWSAAEIIGILIVVNVLANLAHPRLIAPAVSLCVALHFLPLARGLRFRPYWLTGLAMLATSVIAFLLPGMAAPLFASASAALILWATCFAFLRARPEPDAP